MAEQLVQEQIDLSKLEAVPFKSMLTIMNEYVLNNLDFINKINRFGHCNENKLYEMEQALDEIDCKVLLLEQKLNSIPPEIFSNMSQIAAPQQSYEQQPISAPSVSQPAQPQNIPDFEDNKAPPIIEEVQEQAPASNEPDGFLFFFTNYTLENIKRFLKLINYGVPIPAIKAKMVQEGLDPNSIDQFI